jgi:NhaP-type Na+/H+ and K+/H+ antiporter
MEIFIVVVSILIGFSLGWHLRERVAMITANRLLAELEQQVEEETSEEVIKITIEKDRDTLFAYHKDNSQFIAQAKDRAELEKKLAELFPGKRFGVTPQNLIEIGFIS